MTNIPLLVIEDNDTILADSRAIADRLGVSHESFFTLIKRYQEEIEADFGLMRFKIAVKAGPQRGKLPQYALLTEEQAFLLPNHMKESTDVEACKQAIALGFSEACKQLAHDAGVIPEFIDLLASLDPHIYILNTKRKQEEMGQATQAIARAILQVEEFGDEEELALLHTRLTEERARRIKHDAMARVALQLHKL